jgi:DNA-binding LytR/AlgR family response regulator
MDKALIIEDEKPAAEHLQRLIKQIDDNVEIIQILTSTDEALDWFERNPMPDLLFLDIQLADGLSFEIFNHINVTCPVIFTTAYEEYAIKAFKVNSIDYILKPVGIDDLQYALEQFRSAHNMTSKRPDHDLRFRVDQVMNLLTNNYKSRFVVNVGMHIRSIEAGNINLFFSLEKSTFILDNTGKTFDINYSLDQVDKIIDPTRFFRISRKYIVNINAITDIISYSNSRLKLKVAGSGDEDIMVSRSRLAGFRSWLER